VKSPPPPPVKTPRPAPRPLPAPVVPRPQPRPAPRPGTKTVARTTPRPIIVRTNPPVISQEREVVVTRRPQIAIRPKINVRPVVQLEQDVDSDCEDGNCLDKQKLPVSPVKRPAQRQPTKTAEQGEPDHPAPEPYNFQFDSTNEDGSKSFRQEEGSVDGMVKGSYGYTDADGVYRMVEYYADETGFHAVVKTNEPGIESHNSADVQFNAEGGEQKRKKRRV